jgi:large subunit ribosomal protein L3
MAFRPRKRAALLAGRVSKWRTEGTGLMGAIGYKAGMARALVVEDRISPFQGQEVVKPLTIVEVPPLFVYSIVVYEKTPVGFKTLFEIPCTNAPKELKRKTTVARKTAKKIEDYEKELERASFVRVKVCTQPWKSGLGKSKPELIEIGLAGDASIQWNWAKAHLGKEVSAKEVFQEGDFIDAISVSKGKGWQGVVKRFGVALNPRKASKRRRHGGSLGPERQAKVMYTIPRAGQMGFHRRSEGNKKIVRVQAAKELELKGMRFYGVPESEVVLLEGSVPGPAKRVIVLRKSLEKSGVKKMEVKKILA